MIVPIKMKARCINHPKFKNIVLPKYIHMYTPLNIQEYKELIRLRTDAQMKTKVLQRSAAYVYTQAAERLSTATFICAWVRKRASS